MGWIGAIGQRHASISQPPPVGGDPEFGPLLGRQWVIDTAGPRVVADPGGGVSFTTRASLQTAINANPAGSKFVHAAGGTEVWDGTVSCSNKSPKIYFLGLAGSTSTVIDGNGINVIGIEGNQTGAPVEIHGGRFTDFGSTGGGGFVSPFMMRDGWLVEDFVTDNNFNNGFGNQGSNVIVRYGESHHNGTNAWSTTEYEVDGPKRTDNLYEHMHCHDNNTRLLNPGGFAGGVKMLQCARNIGRYIYSHDENGFALWFDTAEGGTLHPGNGFEECVVENSKRSGLFLEGIGSGAFLRRNYVKNCGRNETIGGDVAGHLSCAQIRISDADMTLGGTTRGSVTRNIVDFDLAQTNVVGGLLVFWNHTGHPDRCKNWDFHQNQWWLRGTVNFTNQRLGGYEVTTSNALWTGDNDFFNNEYRVANTGLTYWRWRSGVGDGLPQTYPNWQGFHPGDNRSLIQI